MKKSKFKIFSSKTGSLLPISLNCSMISDGLSKPRGDSIILEFLSFTELSLFSTFFLILRKMQRKGIEKVINFRLLFAMLIK